MFQAAFLQSGRPSLLCKMARFSILVSCIVVLGGASAFLSIPKPLHGHHSARVWRHQAGGNSHAAVRDREISATVKVEDRGQDLEVSPFVNLT